MIFWKVKVMVWDQTPSFAPGLSPGQMIKKPLAGGAFRGCLFFVEVSYCGVDPYLKIRSLHNHLPSYKYRHSIVIRRW